ncbi:MAG: hypothetical protein ABWZ25_01755 [Chitinophagaceae bacterium]
MVDLKMPEYSLDRTQFKAQTAAEAADHSAFYKSISWRERLKIAAYLNSKAFNYAEDNIPRMDKTAFKAKSRT